MYATSSMVAVGQYYVADAYDITLRSPSAEALERDLDKLLGIDKFNDANQQIINAKEEARDAEGNPFDCIIEFNSCMASVVWDVVTLLSGTYIFNVLAIFGVPSPVIAIMILLYSLFLGRTIAGMLRGF